MKRELFLDRFSKNRQISDFIKICLVGAELLEDERSDGQDGRDEANGRFLWFCKRA
jgi:hypothetical protein